MSIVWENGFCTFDVAGDTANGKLDGAQLVAGLNGDDQIGPVAVSVNVDEVDGKSVATVIFESSLSSEEQDLVTARITVHEGAEPKRRYRGTVHFELNPGTRKWTRHIRRISLHPVKFVDVPEISLSGVAFSGSANLKVAKVTSTYFEISVESRGSKKQKRTEPASVSFDWEAAL